MVAKFKFYLDDILVSDPKGWQDLDTTIKRDDAISGLLESQEAGLEFYGDGYDYIKNIFDTQDFCSSVSIKIEQIGVNGDYVVIFTGIIFISECVFDLMRLAVKCKTVDDSFYAKINNNKSIKAKISVGRSKNDVTITAAASRAVQFFNPATGNYDSVNKPHVFTVYEVFKFLVAFMSDGEVSFISESFEPGGKWEGQCITIGAEVRLWDEELIPELSFQDVFAEVNKKNMIGFSIERIGLVPTLRIEDKNYYFTQTSAITLQDAREVVLQMDTTQLYANVHLGSSITDNTTPPPPSFPEDIAAQGFKDETYHVIGTCNIDTTLELMSEWIISSNVIEDIFVAGDSQYDEDIILVDVDLSTNKAVQSNWITPDSTPPFFYNEIYTNENVTEKWFNGIPNSIALFLGNGNNGFRAEAVYSTAVSGQIKNRWSAIQFINDYTPPNNDPNGNYSSPFYTIPNSGFYLFHCYMNLNIPTALYRTFFIRFIQYDSTLTTIIDTVEYNFNVNNSNNIVDITGGLNGNSTDKIAVEAYIYTASIITRVNTGSYFETSFIADGGGIVGNSTPANYKIKKYSFKYPMTLEQFNTIQADTKKQITFTTNNNVQQSGWIDTLKYYRHNKVAEITLITN